MTDRERFSRQMNEVLDGLRKATRKLDAPLVLKDNLTGLGNLREAAYQAGRTETIVSRYPQETAQPAVMRYQKEFADSFRMEPAVLKPVMDGLMTDEIWHNNSAAHFERVKSDGSALIFWIAEAHPAEREHEDDSCYTLELATSEGIADRHKRRLLATEDTDKACRFVRKLIQTDLLVHS